ncbi:IDEAL domain-containing protein [Paenibacillus sp. JX-17]|uniref:IDEAL domain-containing protein n=1 Tax=Paenibacillus lacisoli TaxID=3064525 RepID=A0ABT9C778_9BACL|nr:IDEAL domain-containing protein [Paenibacillus sp. JX-17]MDO7905118.1 IDEAL domain-containing protein [Paenibacillus sp. JX-17]
MMMLKNEQIVEVVKKQIAKVLKKTPIELTFTNDFGRSQTAAADQKLHLTNEHYSAKIMNCVFDTHIRPVLMCEVIYFLKCEYMDGEVELHLEYEPRHDAQQQPDASVYVSFDDKTELGREELDALIDMALATNDKKWFEELTSKINLPAVS